MNVRFLETFLWVATLKSSTAAAKKLGVSQSVVSMRVAALQRELGAELYRGNGRTFELTAAGHRVLAKCSAIVSLAVELQDEVKLSVASPETIHIGVSEIIALSWLPEFLQTLGDDPHCNAASVKSGPQRTLMGWLDTGEIDVAFVSGVINDPTLVSDFICEYDIKWVGSAALVKKKSSINLVELSQLPIIQSSHKSYRHEKVLEYFRWHSGSGAADIQPRNWVGLGFGLEASAHLASKGIGVAALPVTAIEHYLKRGELKVLPVRQEFLPWQIAALRKKSHRLKNIDRVLEAAKHAAVSYARSGKSKYFKPVKS